MRTERCKSNQSQGNLLSSLVGLSLVNQCVSVSGLCLSYRNAMILVSLFRDFLTANVEIIFGKYKEKSIFFLYNPHF